MGLDGRNAAIGHRPFAFAAVSKSDRPLHGVRWPTCESSDLPGLSTREPVVQLDNTLLEALET